MFINENFTVGFIYILISQLISDNIVQYFFLGYDL
jgi:hypothetical protein